MGLLDKLFGRKKPDYPALEDRSEAAEQLKRVESELQTFIEGISEDIEIVPAPDETYVFYGRPPNAFGVAWVREGEVKDLRKVVEERGLAPHRAQVVGEQLRVAYELSGGDDRYSIKLAGRTVVVTPSDGLRRKVHDIVEKLAA